MDQEWVIRMLFRSYYKIKSKKNAKYIHQIIQDHFVYIRCNKSDS